MLRECLLAYQELLGRMLAVTINKFYVGLNSEGKVKVWVNDNLAINSVAKGFEEGDSQVYEVYTN